MAIKNSFTSLTSQIESLMNNSITILSKLSEITQSNNSQIDVTVTDNFNKESTYSYPSVGNLQKQINTLSESIITLSSIDQRGAILKTISGKDKKIISVDLNREPNIIPELSTINNYIPENNWFFDSLLNPMLKVRVDLTDKIQDNVRKILSRRYIIKFDKDQYGEYTTVGLNALNLFNEKFKNRTDILITELENFLSNTDGVAPTIRGNIINYDEQEFELEYNKLQYEGYFTILGTDEDTLNKKMLFQIDTLDYYEIETKQKRQLQLNDELIINSEYSTTRYKIIEINTEASEYRIRLERIEGNEPIPVGIFQGMKFYSDIIDNKNVDISIGFDEYNVIFLKAINTDNYLVGREWSNGVCYYTNDLTLFSEEKLGENGKSLQEYYINTIRDYGNLLKDLVERNIPRIMGLKPNAPVLSDTNFRTRQNNKYLTDTTSLSEQRKKHKLVTELRSKIEETNKLILEKRNELYSKIFRNNKDRLNLENQISKLTKNVESNTSLLESTVNELLTTTQNLANISPSFVVEGFWEIPKAQISTKTKPQEIIGFKIQYKYSNINGKGDENETFKIINNGVETNAVLSPWTTIMSNTRSRVYNVDTQKFEWVEENLSSIDEDNINSLSLPLLPTQQVTIRIKSISEVGYPDSILESDWSNEIAIQFNDELLTGNNPIEQFQKNAELEDLRTRVISDLNRLGLSEHLSSSFIKDNTFYPHLANTLGFQQPDGTILSLSKKIENLENNENLETEKDIELSQIWSSYSKNYNPPKYYKHEGRVYLKGLVKVDNGDEYTNIDDRFPNVKVSVYTPTSNTQYSIIGYLPEGYRPSNITLLSSISNGDDILTRVDILPNGQIVLKRGYTGWVSLDNLSFRL